MFIKIGVMFTQPRFLAIKTTKNKWSANGWAFPSVDRPFCRTPSKVAIFFEPLLFLLQ